MMMLVYQNLMQGMVKYIDFLMTRVLTPIWVQTRSYNILKVLEKLEIYLRSKESNKEACKYTQSWRWSFSNDKKE